MWLASGHSKTVGCVSCHDPHGGEYAHQLRTEESEELCSSCHRQRAVLQGKGARGLEEMRGVHSAVDCVSCHMTEGNHLMKVLRPDDPALSEKRVDTCTACHRDNNRKARGAQVQEWQKSYTERMEALRAQVEGLSAALKEKPGVLNDVLESKWNDVRANLSLLEKDGSRGAHNPDFAIEVMDAAARQLDEVSASVR
jgi:predicted CXXCH cytochrome family protein